jgi:hypothetical protein
METLSIPNSNASLSELKAQQDGTPHPLLSGVLSASMLIILRKG